MKLILKLLQFTFKFLASLFSKIGAQYTYTKLWKYFMKHKWLYIIYKPLKYLFTNFIYFIKLSSAIIAIFSLFNLSIIYYDYDILNEINTLFNNIIKYLRILYNKWFGIEDIEEIEEPIDFFQYKKEVIDKVVNQSPNNSYWIIPIMIIIPIVFYYYNPQVNIKEIIEPIINPAISKIEEYLPKEYATVFISGTIIYKFITVSISNITGYDLNIFTDDNPKPDASKFSSGIVSQYKKDLQEFLNKGKIGNYDPVDSLSSEDKAEFESLFPKEEETPKASTSKLPESKSSKSELPIIGENPYNKISKYDKSPIDSKQVKIEDWN